MQKTKPPQPVSRFRRWLSRILVACFLGVLLWLGGVAWSVWNLRRDLLALQNITQQPFSTQTAQQACSQTQTLTNSIRWVRNLTVPTYPLVKRLGWVPRIGTSVAAAPALSDVGTQGLGLAQTACRIFQPAFDVLDLPTNQRIAALFQRLPVLDWQELRAQFATFSTAWQHLPQTTFDHAPLNAYQQQAQKITALMPDIDAALNLMQQLWSSLPALLGVEKPISLLIAAQNPFELRATGGFIGSIGRVTLDQAKMRDLVYANSASYAYVAPKGSDFPQPYSKYLRASIWTLRDANWWADWPISAQTLATFWELNQQPKVDGVVAVDLYALQYVLAQFPTLDVPNYSVITDTSNLEAIYRGYEPQAGDVGGNKVFLGALFQATIQRMQAASPTELIAVAAALNRALDERHISVFLLDPLQQEPFTAQHWDGSVRKTTGDYLQIVDSDLSYSDVQSFIEQRIQLDVMFDAHYVPLTHTVTLTYTNRYDDWNADQTAHSVWGYCYNTQTQQQERIAGCYGNYVRLYVPKSSIPISLNGADSSLEPTTEQTKTVLGGYLVVLPGETRVISFSYRPMLPAQIDYTLLVQKQAGTLARPVTVQLHTPQASNHVHADLWHDVTLVATLADQIKITSPTPPLHPSNNPERERQFAQAWQAWQAWQGGDQSEAIATWQQSNTLDRALDQVIALRWHEQLDQAQQLLDALKPVMLASGRWSFVAGQIAHLRGDSEQAQAYYQQAIEREPTTQVARFALARLQLASDEVEGMTTLKSMTDPLRWLRQTAWEEWYARDLVASDRTNQQILLLAPDDEKTWEDRYAIFRYFSNPVVWTEVVTLTSEAHITFPDNALWLQRRAEAYQWLNQPELAFTDWQKATVISPTFAVAWYNVGIYLRASGEIEQAQQAFEQSAKHDQTRMEYYIALAQSYEALQMRDQARATYEQAAKLDPNDQGIQDALKRLAGVP